MSRAFDTAFPGYGVPMGGYNLSSGFIKPLRIDDTGALVVAASVSASIAAFLPTGHATLAVTVATGNVAFGSADNSLVLRNIGSQACYFKLGAAGVTAAVTDFYLAAGDWCCLDRTGQVRIAAITATGTTTLEIWTGTGLASLSQAGGSGGGGGNVNINQVGGAAVALGQTTMANSFPVAIASNQSALPVTGTFWQATQPVSLTTLPALTAGAALIGKVGIDQTTNGVTNAVDILNMPVTLDTNSGNKSASTIRVLLATDSVAIPNWGQGATGAAVPTGAIYLGMNVAGNLTGLVGTANGLKVDGSAVTQPVSGTFWQATQPISGTTTSSNFPVTVDTNSGNTGASTIRVVVATNNPANALWGHGGIGAAVPANATYYGLMARTTNPAAATDGNLVGPMADKLGRQVVVIGQVRDLKTDAQLTLTSSVAETTLLAAVASTFQDMYGLIIENTSATPCEVEFRDTTGGALRFSFEVPANDTRGFMLPSSDGYKQAAVNTNWTAKCITSVASIKISALFVKNI